MSTKIREAIANSTIVEDRTWQQNPRLGYVSFTVDERETLSWSRERRLKEFQKVNEGIESQVLETKLSYIDTLTIDNGEILDVLELNPSITWEKVRDVFIDGPVPDGPVNGYTSTLHSLDAINYPEHFWKAIIENEREKLIAPARPI